MVLALDIPLRPPERAVLEFLLGVVFGPQRNLSTYTSRRSCQRHDVAAASHIIRLYLDRGRRKSGFTDACHLVYGNTIVLSTQVARLLRDAIRAKELLSYSSYLAEEEERRRRTREQMENGLIDNSKTPKKKKRSNGADEDEFAMKSPVSVALKKDITMRDVLGTPQIQNIEIDDDLAPATVDDLALLYGFLGSEATQVDKTFIDQQSSSAAKNREELIQDFDFDVPPPPPRQSFAPPIDDDFEFQRLSDEMIQQSHQTPVKKRRSGERTFEPGPHLAEVLLYGRLPLVDERRSMEDEMEDARNHGINNDNLDVPSALVDVPRLPSQISLDDIPFPSRPPQRTPFRTPQSTRKAKFDVYNGEVDPTQADNNRFRIPLREMNRMMEDFSSLHYEDGKMLRVKPAAKSAVKELFRSVPYFIKDRRNADTWDVLDVGYKKPNSSISGNTVSEDEDEIESSSGFRRPKQYKNLEPIDLSNLKVSMMPLKETSPVMSPLRPVVDGIDMEDLERPRDHNDVPPEFDFPRPEDVHREPGEVPEEIEFPRREDNGSNITKIYDDAMLDEDPFPTSKTFEPPSAGDKSAATIREELLRQCEEESPYPIQLDSMTPIETTSRREAARTFYVVLELIKNRRIEVTQVSPFGQIDVQLSAEDFEDLAVLAMEEEMDDGDF
ncbi:hypothetical protein L5515_000037 [Caenorhabditis briggsae]|uniref:Rad21/Rec8-like protein C-terminal eukaryotic domain-containing protein n=1 Tax=Caenorhabditis briggsae TaxID=6238 RepID=A0AAE9E187_CAEBR|nr:hypothetical protein L5515_000037 [Caenorhabditis briggsae]